MINEDVCFICPCFLRTREDKMLFKVVTLWPGLLFWQTLMAPAPQKAKVHVRTSLEAITLESATFAQLKFFNCTYFKYNGINYYTEFVRRGTN